MGWFLLAANDFDWIRLIVPAIVFIIFIFNQLFAAAKKGLPPAQRRVQPPMRPKQPGQVPPVPKKTQPADALSAEIEKFLKDAVGRRQSTQRPKPAAPPPVQVVTQVEVVSDTSRESVAKSVAKHLDTHRFGDRADQMTDDMKRADAQREQHFKKTFSHQIGRLADTSSKEVETSGQQDAAVPASPSDIAQLLASPLQVRNAIILNEILQPPSHRW
jgi:hypothetical protein